MAIADRIYLDAELPAFPQPISEWELFSAIWCRELLNITGGIHFDQLTYSSDNTQTSTVESEKGHIVQWQRDPTAIQLSISNNQDSHPWFKCKLRNRIYDGSESYFPTELTPWDYSNPSDIPPSPLSAEISTYWLHPSFPLIDKFNEQQSIFIANPFDQLPFHEPTFENLQAWVAMWQELAPNHEVPYPGYYSFKHIPGLSEHVFSGIARLLKSKQYTHLTAVPTWFHIAQRFTQLGLRYHNTADADQINSLRSKLPEANSHERRWSSWVMMLQFCAQLAEAQGIVPEELLPSEYQHCILRDAQGKLITYPLNPNYNIWQVMDL